MSPVTNLLVLIGYFLVLMFISWVTSKNADKSSFYTGDRKSPWFLVAFGMIGASLSGVTFISIPGWVSATHFGYMQTVFGYLIGYVIISQVLLPLYYRLKLTSIYTYLEQRYGSNGYKTGAAYFLISRVIGASFRLFLVAGVLHMAIFKPLFTGFDFPYWGTVAITILLIFTYTTKSGIKTVVYTDVFQTTFLVLAVVLTIGYIASQLNLDFSGVVQALIDDPNTQIFHWDWKSNNFFWKQFIGGAFIALVMTGLDQDMMQKNLSIKNIKSAKKNIYAQMVMFIIVNIVFLSLGALLYQYQAFAQIDAVGTSDQLFPTIALQHASPMIGLFFVLGLVAAAYSSADSALTALTTSFCVDFLGFETKRPTDIKTRRWVHLGFAGLLFITILVFKEINNEAVIKQLFTAAGFTYGPLLGLFFFGILTQIKVKDRSIPMITIISIIITWLYYTYSPQMIEGYKPGFELILINGSITFALLALAREKKHHTEVLDNEI
ncbi:MAG: SSS family solute:Na+ symporter [Bacteroidia bacterium]|jgi:SSS family solute:Na+ symporter